MTNKTLSPLGKHLRKLRIDLDLDVTEMAEALGVSSAKLTRIELGKVSPRGNFVEAIIRKYGDPTKVWALANQSQTKIEFVLSGLSEAERLAVIRLHRQIYGEAADDTAVLSNPEDPNVPLEMSVISAEEEREMSMIDEGADTDVDGVGFIEVDEEIGDMSVVSTTHNAKNDKPSFDIDFL